MTDQPPKSDAVIAEADLPSNPTPPAPSGFRHTDPPTWRMPINGEWFLADNIQREPIALRQKKGVLESVVSRWILLPDARVKPLKATPPIAPPKSDPLKAAAYAIRDLVETTCPPGVSGYPTHEVILAILRRHIPAPPGEQASVPAKAEDGAIATAQGQVTQLRSELDAARAESEHRRQKLDDFIAATNAASLQDVKDIAELRAQLSAQSAENASLAATVERYRKALEKAEAALASCYDVVEWPSSGESSQDIALAAVRAALTPDAGNSDSNSDSERGK